MGPRSVERGNPNVEPHVVPAGDASMGPRSVERGNALKRSHQSLFMEGLQWGRVRLNAETNQTSFVDAPDYRRFNGAAFG